MSSKERIAVVGSGVAGLGAAWSLARTADVHLFEAADHPGGHVRTVAGPTGPVDTGFIVYNEANYPLLTRLFAELGIVTRPAPMSFSCECACGVCWSSRRPWRARGLATEIARFLLTAGRAPTEGRSLQGLLDEQGYSAAFGRHYLMPMVAALWSSSPGAAFDVPAAAGLAFFHTHGLLGLRRRRWRTVVGGASTYAEALVRRCGCTFRGATPVGRIARDERHVELTLGDGEVERFDGVVIATHAPDALALLADPSTEERRLLGSFQTTANTTVLHTDERLLPRRPGDRASWNYRAAVCGGDGDGPTVTYSMNRLQGLPGPTEVLVTLNRLPEIDPSTIIRVVHDRHPLITFESVAARAELHTLNTGRTAFCGAWQGYGFHEDGLASGVRAARALGGRWP
jgi:predicted NAD/FAD-binding protein